MLFKAWEFCVVCFRSKVFMPLAIQNAYTTWKPITNQNITSLLQNSPNDTVALIQWGTLIIFDNLIGHTDRYNAYICRYLIKFNYAGMSVI